MLAVMGFPVTFKCVYFLNWLHEDCVFIGNKKEGLIFRPASLVL